MKRNAQVWMLLALTALAISVTGCGSDKIDPRQLDLNDGLAYKHGSDNPFTGDVVYKDSMPNNLAAYWNGQIDNSVILGPAAQSIISSCTVHYSAGLVDGNSFCVDEKGNTILELNYKNEKYDGVSKLSNPDTGNVVAYLAWNGGKWDGKLKVTTWDGTIVVNDASWKDGHVDSGKVINSGGSFEYDDGKKNGPATLVAGKFVYGKGSYKDDQRDGEWIDAGSALQYEGWLQNVENATFGGGSIILSITSIKSNWLNGKLDGKISFYGNDDKLLADATASDGSIVPGSVHVYSSKTDSADASQASDGKSPVDACVDARIDAFHRAQGADAPISNDQLTEWRDDCQQGKQAPQ